jgi:DNA-binding MarR family transcriptional regulator/N-acetylglutamate synthase-like GNAT family acetyltransferase
MGETDDTTRQDPVPAIRAFNRFYTNHVGLLRGKYLDTPYSLTEGRLLYELAQDAAVPVIGLRRSLDIDAGYLSRVLRRFESDGLITRQRDEADARRQVVALTESGRRVIGTLDKRSAEQVRAMLAGVCGRDRGRLLDAMGVITDVLGGRADVPGGGGARPRTFTLRPPRAGDMGWVVQQHGALYAREYGLDSSFEALVARIVADYLDNLDPRREAAWIAEVDGASAGCVFCVKASDTTAKLRLLLVQPWARGMGLGARLVDEVLDFARQAGYSDITLWTNDVLVSARRIYEAAGFTLTDEHKHHSFGQDLVGQNWARSL